uniref:Uncharacterized protein n=1 Tax=Arundo donax TaxID=35708 RepID=A0A0A9FT88_ARUDO
MKNLILCYAVNKSEILIFCKL